MSGVKQRSIAAWRWLQEQYMPDVVTILRKGAASNDGAGGITQAGYTTIYTTKGRLRQIGESPNERLIAERLGSSAAVVVSIPYGTDVLIGDRVRIQGTTWDVADFLSGSYQTVIQMVCTNAHAD